MKKLQMLLYVGSIVVAVGIGMFNLAGIESGRAQGGGGDFIVVTPTCDNKLGCFNICTSTSSKLQTTSIGGNYNAAASTSTYCDVPSCVAESHGNFIYNSD